MCPTSRSAIRSLMVCTPRHRRLVSVVLGVNVQHDESRLGTRANPYVCIPPASEPILDDLWIRGCVVQSVSSVGVLSGTGAAG